jgi:hypothetical protein
MEFSFRRARSAYFSVVHDGQLFHVYCFRKQADAQEFLDHFECEPLRTNVFEKVFAVVRLDSRTSPDRLRDVHKAWKCAPQ